MPHSRIPADEAPGEVSVPRAGPPETPTRELRDGHELVRLLEAGTPLRGLRLQGLDLTASESALLARTDLTGLVVLGGTVSPRLAAHMVRRGAILFPAVPDAPVDPYRGRLYTPTELYADLADGYAATPDARTYAWSRDATQAHDVYVTALRALHDDAMSDALDEAVLRRRVVGVMGGHATLRGSVEFERAARLGALLAGAGLVVATGGGPGSMEAANLGALTAGLGADVGPFVLARALDQLADVPSFVPDVTAWAHTGFTARADILAAYDGDGGGGADAGNDPAVPVTLGMPTWFYGQEPTNVFATGIAKFFSNAVREDGLLSRCGAGIIVLPGAAGTVQEIFQAVTPRYYGTASLGPLVLVDRQHWTDTVPVWVPLQALARHRDLADLAYLVHDVEEAAGIVGA